MNLYIAMEHWFPNNSYIDYNLKVVLKHSFYLQKENVESCIQYLQTIGINCSACQAKGQ